MHERIAMTDGTETDVMIVGAGPTGLSLAIELGLRGVRALVVERHAADRLAAAGQDDECAFDAAFAPMGRGLEVACGGAAAERLPN
jgi:2-polyprenyl-6-methoxyphenol hydroxylase-like FAD-dependent oxidoreductase